MTRKMPPISLLDEEVVARTAKILGPSSAAQLALDDAKARRNAGQKVIFAQSGQSILVIDEAALAEAEAPKS